ncbi:hypothetical protein PV327_001624 [Microctonus hyperodae]|uniref:Uncharacterized protein n=1 Tax=Microctonus hyperodae TaxID=165561 RepID=A0AA39FDV7_MICHY|nr:hypothetical protein PV327_001624 [Microctonus hyperodae]
MAGYLAKKCVMWIKCAACLKNAITDESEIIKEYLMIDLMDRGGLKYSSKSLVSLLSVLENHVMRVITKDQLQVDTFFKICYALEDHFVSCHMVGCSEHWKTLSQRFIKFYLIMRSHMLAKSTSQQMNKKLIEMTREARKKAKL